MSNLNKIKLIAIDLDNTLLKDDKTISPEDWTALKACLENGIDIVIASGRFQDSHKKIVEELNLDLEEKEHIAEGGGLIYSKDRYEILGKLERKQYLEVLNKLKQKNVIPFVSDGIYIYYDDIGPLNKIYGLDTKTNNNQLKRIKDLKDVKEPLKFILFCEDFDQLKEFQEIIDDDLKAFISARNIAEITSTHLDKWFALQKILKEKGISNEEVAAIGDSGNDLMMIKNAGLGLAVKNALPEVLENADFIAHNDNNHNAVSELIKNYIL